MCHRPKMRTYEIMGKPYTVSLMCACDEAQEMADERERMRKSAEQRRSMTFKSSAARHYRFESDGGQVTGVKRRCMNYAASFDKALRDGYGLVLYGKPDQGKTYLCGCIANMVIDEGYTVAMLTVPGLVAETKGSGDAGEWMRDVKGCDLLILDDLGAERDTTFSRETLYRVIDTRYMSRKPMIVSTNLSLETLTNPGSLYDWRIFNRILERCLPVEVNTGRHRISKETYEEIKGLCDGRE